MVRVLDDMHQSLEQVGVGVLQVLGQVDMVQVLELVVDVEQVVGKGQVEVEDEGEV